MRIFCLAEGAPVEDPAVGNGSTMISANLLARLSPDVQVDLAFFGRGEPAISRELRARLVDLTVFPVRGGRRAMLAQPVTRLPRATWQRAVPAGFLRERSARAHITYLHGLHATAGVEELTGPVLTHLVDPWSEYWRERARGRSGARRWYDLHQARRAEQLELRCARRSASVVLVNDHDASRSAQRWGTNVVAIPNGVTTSAAQARRDVGGADGPVVFVGTLDYPPNLEALRVAVDEVLPRVRARRPDVQFVIAGRRPTAEVEALAEAPGISVLGAVPDVAEVFTGAGVALYAGRSGRGTKNTVGEALAAGCPVVASVEAARGWTAGDGLAVGSTAEELSDAVLMFLQGQVARPRRAVRSWDEAAREFEQLLRSVASPSA